MPAASKVHVVSARSEAKAGGFWAHVAGTAYKMVVEHAVAGLRIDNYRTTLPFKKGLSSSAAVCVAVRHHPDLAKSIAQLPGMLSTHNRGYTCMQQVARSFNRAYGLQLSTRGEMECAYQGERLTPSLCGRMVSTLPVAAGYVGWPCSSCVRSSMRCMQVCLQ
jgi:galactokinase